MKAVLIIAVLVLCGCSEKTEKKVRHTTPELCVQAQVVHAK